MMFCKKYQFEIKKLEERLLHLEQENTRLEAEMIAREQQASTRLDELQAELRHSVLIYQTMKYFFDSLLEIQKSQLKIANSMKEGRLNAIEASHASSANRAAIEKISQNLRTMSQDTKITAISLIRLTMPPIWPAHWLRVSTLVAVILVS